MKNIPLFICFCTILSCLSLPSFAANTTKNFESVTIEHKIKLETAITELSAQRDRIQESQIPLAKKLNTLRNQVRLLRKEATELQSIQDSKSVDLETLETRIIAQRKEYDYITNILLGEYTAAYHAGLSAGERASYGETLRQLNLLIENPSATKDEIIKKHLALINESRERIDLLFAGMVYPGEALDENGIITKGQFIQAGPLLYFTNKQSNAGLIEENIHLRPQLHPLNPKYAKQIDAIVETGTGNLPIDPSLKYALLIEQTQDSLLIHLKKGGIWVFPILTFTMIATLVALFKLFQIFRIRQPEAGVVYELVKLLRDGKKDKAKSLAETLPEPCREMLLNAILHSDEPIELVEEVMYESMLGTQPRLERFLNVIAVTAATAPLLGLLGTVTGIIKTFKLMNVFGAGDPKPLISGISEALITTELGLVLAIPALIIYAILSRRVAGIMARMEKLAIAFINDMSRKN